MRKLLCIVPACHKELYTKGVNFGILMRDLNGYWDEVFTIHPFCDIERQIKLSSRHTVLEFKTWDLRIIPRLVKLVKEQGITVIKAHDPFLCGLLGLVVSGVCHIPYIVAIYSSYDLLGKSILGHYALDRIVSHIVMKRASLVFVGTEPARKLALSMGAKESIIRKARSANVQASHFDEPRESGGRGNTVLFAGRLSAEKYVPDVVRAFSVIAANVPKAELHIYGEGDTDVGTQAEELGLAEKVTLFGFQSQERIREALLSAGVLLVPLGGNVLVEACLSRTPVVAYDVDWHSELIEHSKSGMLAPFRDWHTMGEMATQILRDRELAARLGRAARVQAVSQRHPDVLYRIEAQAFGEILSKGGKDGHSTGKG